MEVGCSKTYSSFLHARILSCKQKPIVILKKATVLLHKKLARTSSRKSKTQNNVLIVCWKIQPSMCVYGACTCGWNSRRKWRMIMNSRKGEGTLTDIVKKQGTIVGAVSLIIGTSIGSGILALPQKTSPAGLLPSSISLILCWAFLVLEALLLVEVNIGLLRKKNILNNTNELETISIRTMAQETLGEWGGLLSTVTYVFLAYTSMIAYASKSAEILHRWIDLPESVSGIFFTSIFTILVSFGGTRTTDQTNQCLTATMICLLVAIEVVAVAFEGWPVVRYDDGDWGKVPATIPVMIFALVYHDLAPVLCAYLGGDRIRIRASILIGSILPLVALLVWNAIALGLQDQVDDHVADPVQLLMRVKWEGMSFIVQAFSLLAVGTSLVGTLLGFTEFFKEELNKVLNLDALAPKPKILDSPFDLKDSRARKKISLLATAMVIFPSLCVSTTIPDIFSAATDIAGGYCMTVLYGIIPPAMMWAWLYKNAEDSEKNVAPAVRLALFCVGMVAGLVLVEQLLQDCFKFSFLK